MFEVWKLKPYFIERGWFISLQKPFPSYSLYLGRTQSIWSFIQPGKYWTQV